MKKLLLCIQLSPHDAELGKGLLRLITDIEPQKCEVADLLISYRFDMARSREIEEYCARRFNVLTHITRRKSVGWPEGCNAMMADTYSVFIENTRSGKWDYDYLFLTEADCVPLRSTWLEEIQRETYTSGKLVNGPWFEADDYGCKHINGNCLIHRGYWKQNKQIVAPPGRIGWDAKFGQHMQLHGNPSRLIYSHYRWGMPDNPYHGIEELSRAFRYPGPSNPLYGQDLFPAYIHGGKIKQIQEDVRKKLLTPTEAT